MKRGFLPKWLSAGIVLCFMLFAYSCKKAKNTSKTSRAGQMAGVRLWHRNVHDVRIGLYDTTYNLPDTSFAGITVVNDNTIQFGTSTLNYVDSLSNDSVLDYYYESPSSSTAYSVAVQYYLLSDSISVFSHHSLGGFGFQTDLYGSTHK